MDDRSPRGLTDDDRAVWVAETRNVFEKSSPKNKAGSGAGQPGAESDQARKTVSTRGVRRAKGQPKRQLISEADMAAWNAEIQDLGHDADSTQSQAAASKPSVESKPVTKIHQQNRRRSRSDPPPLEAFDRKLHARLAKGQDRIDARLDLHGLTEKRAAAALTGFVQKAHGRGQRNVLVITGKGNRTGLDEFNRPKSGVLRRSVPEFLARRPLSLIVHSFAEAHERHGGAGALYVRLRRRRHDNSQP